MTATFRGELVAPFLSAARRDPRAVWAFGERGEHTLGGARERALAAADGLRDPSLAPGTLVALSLPPGPGAVEALVAVWSCELVPILLDPAVPDAAARRAAEGLGAALLWRPPADDPRGPLAVEPEPVEPAEAVGGRAPRRLPEAAAVKLTSGSTGDPQGVVVGPVALASDTRALVRCLGLSAEDRSLVLVPLSHSYGFSVLTFPVLSDGIPLVFPGAEGPLAAARRHAATFLPSVPAWYRSILRSCAPEDFPRSLRLLVSAGAPLDAPLAREFRARFGRPIHVLYGASECGSIAYDREGGAAERGSVGTPLDGVEVELVAPEAFDAGDAGTAGEGIGRVCVRSPAVAEGYLPERGGARLGGGRFLTEDLARLRGGELELRGRESEWINVRGHKVDPRAVERVLREHPDVDEVCVLGKRVDGREGETLRAVIACPDGSLRFLDVVEWCRSRLAPYQIPRSVAFVRELPRTERGKLDRARLNAL